MASVAARAVICELRTQEPSQSPQAGQIAGSGRVRLTDLPSSTPFTTSQSTDQTKIILQPRLCTLRSYGSDRGGVLKTRIQDRGGSIRGVGSEDLSPFLSNLYEYIESSKKSHDFEIISGRLAMIIFATTVGIEFVTGNSVFRKLDVQGIEEAAGACVAAVAFAATFAWFTSARGRVGRIFTTSCNTFIEALIDNIIDGLFYDIDPSDWSDEI